MENFIGMTLFSLMMFAPPILWTVALKKFFKINVIKSVIIALAISIYHFILNEYLSMREYQYVSILTPIIYLVYAGTPIVLLVVPRKNAKGGSYGEKNKSEKEK